MGGAEGVDSSRCVRCAPVDGKAPCPLIPFAGIMQGDSVAVSVGLELPGTDRYPFTRGTVLGSGERTGSTGTVSGQPTVAASPTKWGSLETAECAGEQLEAAAGLS